MAKTIVTDKFWQYYRDLIKREMIPYQWKVLSDEIDVNIERERNDDSIPNEKSHAIENFRIAAGLAEGSHYGWVFQDSDVYKWLEAVAHTLRNCTDEKLIELADSVVDLIADAQEEDGYLSTYFTIDAPERKFKFLAESHELYCAGHFMEAAAAYNEATGNTKVLDVACKLADCIDNYFGSEPGKHFGYDGHEEVEIGLMKLYEVTGNEKYMKLADYFLRIRGTDENFFGEQLEDQKGLRPIISGGLCPRSYYQLHKPVLEQDTAEGHAVRLAYMCTSMAMVAYANHDEQMLNACKRIWRNIVDKRMYITGGIGSTVILESFTYDYDLPNDTMYCETCASVALTFFAYEMLRNETRGEYADVMERALYNTVLGGVALDGKHFFYVNPLYANPEAYRHDPTKSHVKPVRAAWLGCACCPPNLARLVASVEKYVYLVKDNELLINLYAGSEINTTIKNTSVKANIETKMPWYGENRIKISKTGSDAIRIGLRIPGWAGETSIIVNGKTIDNDPQDGYLFIELDESMDDIEIMANFSMPIRKWRANARVRSDIGKLALQRGPFVYCMESVDNGKELDRLSISVDTDVKEVFAADELNGVMTLEAKGLRIEDESDKLYVCADRPYNRSEQTIRFIPYYSWANRGENEMSVWINEK